MIEPIFYHPVNVYASLKGYYTLFEKRTIMQNMQLVLIHKEISMKKIKIICLELALCTFLPYLWPTTSNNLVIALKKN
jgi:hypothetical protein